MAILDNLVVNVALPTISRDLNATTTQLQWIVSAYTLVFASLQITAGGLGDRFGRKRFFLIGLGLFTTASLFAALSQNIGMLIAARAVQGMGAAFIMPLSLSLISVAFPPEERGKALGIWSAISVSGLAFGPIVGGALVQYANWHWVFIINIPIGIIAFFVSSAVVKESRDTSGTVATDIPGTVLITGAIAALTWGLIEASDRGWTDTLILLAFGVAVVLFAAFIAVETRTARPMVPLRFFRSSTFTGANMDAFAVSFLIAGVAFYMTLYQQNIHGYSPVRAGLTMLPMVVVMMVASPISGILAGRIGSRSLISLGMAIAGVGALLFLRGGVSATYLTILPAYIVMGLGLSLIFAPMTTAVMNSVESEKSGIASAVNGAVREIGGAFGIALLGTVMNQAYKADFNADAAIAQARSNPELGPLHKVIDLIGSGASFAGHVIEDSTHFPGLPAPLVAALRNASGHAFITGMDRAIIVSSLTIIGCSIVSFFLIRERQPAIAPVPVAEITPAPAPTLIADVPAPAFASAIAQPASAVSGTESDPLVAAFAQLIAAQVAAAQEPVAARLAALERAVREIALARNVPMDDLPDYRTEPVGAAGE
jgi:EmrB/QacA subfamily drug resistance transporter